MLPLLLPISVLALIVLLYFIVLLPTGHRTPAPELLTDYAHRGLHGDGIPENSLAAFRKAAEMGYGMELDVQLSADGEVMVFHDYTLERMTGRAGKLADYSAAELDKMALAGTDEKIPRLTEVLALVNGRVPLLIELKGENLKTALAPKLDSLLAGYHGSYCIESFNPFLLVWHKKHRPNVFRGLLLTNTAQSRGRTPLNLLLDLMAFNWAARPHFISYNSICETRFPVRFCTDLCRAARFTWTVRTEEEYRKARDAGVCTIFEGFLPPHN